MEAVLGVLWSLRNNGKFGLQLPLLPVATLSRRVGEQFALTEAVQRAMPKKKKWREPELPWSLQDELNPDRVRDAKAPKKKAVGPNRKQMRKEARKQKKARPRPPGRPKSEPEREVEPEPEPPRKEKKRAAAPAPAPTPAKKKKPSHTPTVFEEMLRERGVLKSTEGRGAGGQSMDAIDDHIDDLERKLGLKKGKTAKAAKQRLERELAEDGLGSSAAG